MSAQTDRAALVVRQIAEAERFMRVYSASPERLRALVARELAAWRKAP